MKLFLIKHGYSTVWIVWRKCGEMWKKLLDWAHVFKNFDFTRMTDFDYIIHCFVDSDLSSAKATITYWCSGDQRSLSSIQICEPFFGLLEHNWCFGKIQSYRMHNNAIEYCIWWKEYRDIFKLWILMLQKKVQVQYRIQGWTQKVGDSEAISARICPNLLFHKVIFANIPLLRWRLLVITK